MYAQFVAISQQPGSQRKETQFLLNAMYSPLTNSVERICDSAISSLYTVSSSLVANLRALLQKICNDPSLCDREPDPHGLSIYRHTNHPMNKLPHAVRVRVEQELDMVTRADPGAADNSVTVRVYNPEVNTYEKLINLLLDGIGDDAEISVHPSTVRRTVHSYLAEKGFRISFTKRDHNSCPNCKEMSHAALRFHHEGKRLCKILKESSSIGNADHMQMVNDLERARYQEMETINLLNVHQTRHLHIRRTINKLVTYFKGKENEYRRVESPPFQWRARQGHSHVSHQDASTKIDLPSIVVERRAI